MKEWGPVRNEFLLEMGACAVCRQCPAEQCHEISRGPARDASLSRRETWLGVCSTCHDLLDDYSQYPIERQLAIKLLVDPEWFDIRAVNELRGRAPDAITLPEVVDYLREMVWT